MGLKIKSFVYRVIDILMIPFAFFIARFSKLLRTNHFQDFPITKKIFFWIGVYPIKDHYYDPLFNLKYLKYSLRKDRTLPGINLNNEEQLEILNNFNYSRELSTFPRKPSDKNKKYEYCYSDEAFMSADSEFLYSIIRYFKPQKIVEIGCGLSTLMARNAIEKNINEEASYHCNHICIEPFENKWLEDLNITIVRKMVEEVEIDLFKSLNKNDILFIDSSHIIRPQGDVLFEYLSILPVLKPGVFVHVHDIFTPKDYLNEWLEIGYLWNEQYLLEAFLTNNKEFRIIGALNCLFHHFKEQLTQKFPVIKEEVEQGIYREPGSFWMVKN